MTTPRQAREASLAALRDALEATGPRPCRWPTCTRPALPVAVRGWSRKAPPAAGGRRPEFCSEQHQRWTLSAVKTVGGLVTEAQALREQAPAREHRVIDGFISDATYRLRALGENPDNHRAAPPPGAHIDGSSNHGTRAGVGPRPVLGVRSGHYQGFTETWEHFRDTVAATRPLLNSIATVHGDSARKALASAYWRDLLSLLGSAHAVADTLVGLRPREAQARGRDATDADGDH
jgi:hypothetical protein